MPYYVVQKRQTCMEQVTYRSLYGDQLMSLSHSRTLIVKANNSKDAANHVFKRVSPTLGLDQEPTYTIDEAEEKELLIGRDHIYADIFVKGQERFNKPKRKRIIQME